MLFRSATTKVILSGASQPTKDWGGLKREGAILSSYLLLYVMGKSRKKNPKVRQSQKLIHKKTTPRRPSCCDAPEHFSSSST